MEKNYMFQNYGYVDKPVNFKHVVIDLLRRYGLFIHMRDEPSNIYDLDKFLYETNPMGIPYHEEKIKKLYNRVKDAGNKLKELNVDSDKLYQEYYDEGLKEYNKVVETNKYYKEYRERADKYIKRVHNIQDFLYNFHLENQEFSNLIKETLSGCIEALMEDYDSNIKRAVINDVRDSQEPYSPMPKEEWIQVETNRCKDEIEWCTKQIEEEKKAIKSCRKKDKLIKEIFMALEPFDREIE